MSEVQMLIQAALHQRVPQVEIWPKGANHFEKPIHIKAASAAPPSGERQAVPPAAQEPQMAQRQLAEAPNAPGQAMPEPPPLRKGFPSLHGIHKDMDRATGRAQRLTVNTQG